MEKGADIWNKSSKPVTDRHQVKIFIVSVSGTICTPHQIPTWSSAKPPKLFLIPRKQRVPREVFQSEYVTDQEKKEMFKDFYSVALCPKKYRDSPQALRERIRKNEAIIYEREVQSCFKKGKFKTDKKVGFGD